METNVSSQASTENKCAKNKVVAVIGRWMPIHEGHKRFLIKLAKDSSFDKVIVMIGSCYEGGDPRYCITATEREKMLRAIFKRENIPEERYVFVPIPDVPTFEEWKNLCFVGKKTKKQERFSGSFGTSRWRDRTF